MLLLDFRNIKSFQDKNSQKATKNIKKAQKEANSSYLAPLYSTSSVLIDHVISILINLAEEIKKGIGCTKLENLVNQILLNDEVDVLQDNIITLPSGATIGIWKNNTLKLSKDVNVDKEHFVKYIIKYFAKEAKNK